MVCIYSIVHPSIEFIEAHKIPQSDITKLLLKCGVMDRINKKFW